MASIEAPPVPAMEAYSVPSAPHETICVRPLRSNYIGKIPNPPYNPPKSTLHNDIPDYLVGPERIVQKHTFTTHNSVVHDNKFYQGERDFQPNHRLAPSLNLIHSIRPDNHRKIQGVASVNMKAYNPFPNRVSETKANFTPHYQEQPLFGQAGIFITDHFVYLPEKRTNVLPSFTYDDQFSIMRKAHPYMTTYRLYHRNFEAELPKQRFLDQLWNQKIGPAVPKSQNDTDCAVKMLVRPMLDSFEQQVVRENQLPSLDQKRLKPGEARNFAHLKHFFRRPPYYGCPPRVHQPVPHVGMNTTYKDVHGHPFHPNMALNHSIDEKALLLQPRQSLAGLMRVPYTYDSENNIYGSGKNVAYYHDNRLPVQSPVERAQVKRNQDIFRAAEIEGAGQLCGKLGPPEFPCGLGRVKTRCLYPSSS